MTGRERVVFRHIHLFGTDGFSDDLGYLVVNEGKVESLGLEPGPRLADYQERDGQGNYLAPGFWDLQLNGFAGIDLFSATKESIGMVLRYCARFGVTTVFPTVTTGSKEKMMKAIKTISEVEDQKDQACIGGIHVEGPMISSGGGKGCHPKEHIRPLLFEEFQLWQEMAGGRIAIVTLAPEAEGALEMISQLTDNGVVVAIGHTDASREVILEAIKRGAKLSTHLWNACKKELLRDLEHIGAMLASDETFASFIADGHHIHPDVLAISLRAKPKDRAILVTDAMAGAAAVDGLYPLGDLKIKIIEGVARDPNDSRQLAGSTLTLDKAVEKAVSLGRISLSQAVNMVTKNPALLLCRSGEARLEIGAKADLVLLSFKDEALKIEEVMRAGKFLPSRLSTENCPFCGSCKVDRDPTSSWYVDDLGPLYAPKESEWLCMDCGAFFDKQTRKVRAFGFVRRLREELFCSDSIMREEGDPR